MHMLTMCVPCASNVQFQMLQGDADAKAVLDEKKDAIEKWTLKLQEVRHQLDTI